MIIMEEKLSRKTNREVASRVKKIFQETDPRNKGQLLEVIKIIQEANLLSEFEKICRYFQPYYEGYGMEYEMRIFASHIEIAEKEGESYKKVFSGKIEDIPEKYNLFKISLPPTKILCTEAEDFRF